MESPFCSAQFSAQTGLGAEFDQYGGEQQDGASTISSINESEKSRMRLTTMWQALLTAAVLGNRVEPNSSIIGTLPNFKLNEIRVSDDNVCCSHIAAILAAWS